MLGWIGDDAELGVAALDRAQAMAAEIDRVIAGRAIVFSTGPEVASGQIEDTNKPWILSRLTEAGYSVTAGENLPDDTTLIAAALREAAEERGFGLIVTTGGVGAEGKDGTVEALLCVDPDAATPHLFFVEQGVGRHRKPGVRIGVGSLTGALIVCLPGPHLEAIEGTRSLVTALGTTREPAGIASAIAATLRRRLHAGASAGRHP
jgi:molybdenum cofactor synthesis domain-containing protein